MSTLKKNITAQRIGFLAAKKELIFHAGDLSNLWGINNPNLLRTTLKRYVRSGLLHRIYRGFFSLVPPKELDPFLLGAKALHRFCYLTTESILYEHGFISQKPSVYTFVSEKPARLSIFGENYVSRQLNPRYLYCPEGILTENGVNFAVPERAVADLLYFNPKASLDKPVNWRNIQRLQKTIGYPLTPHRYDFAKTH